MAVAHVVVVAAQAVKKRSEAEMQIKMGSILGYLLVVVIIVGYIVPFAVFTIPGLVTQQPFPSNQAAFWLVVINTLVITITSILGVWILNRNPLMRDLRESKSELDRATEAVKGAARAVGIVRYRRDLQKLRAINKWYIGEFDLQTSRMETILNALGKNENIRIGFLCTDYHRNLDTKLQRMWDLAEDRFRDKKRLSEVASRIYVKKIGHATLIPMEIFDPLTPHARIALYFPDDGNKFATPYDVGFLIENETGIERCVDLVEHLNRMWTDADANNAWSDKKRVNQIPEDWSKVHYA